MKLKNSGSGSIGFQTFSPADVAAGLTAAIPVFDFCRPDQIAKSQMRAIHMLHENFVRNVVASLSAYIRTYVVVNLVAIEQITYSEFLGGLPSPTFMASLGLAPYDGHGILEINPSLVFPILEMLLGGTGKRTTEIRREVTEIEQNLLDGLLRIILHDLQAAWETVARIGFTVESLDTEPHFLQLMPPHEGVIAVNLEMKIGETSGLVNLVMPSLMIKMMRQKFDQQWSARKSDPTPQEQQRMFELIPDAKLTVEARLNGPGLMAKDLLELNAGDVLVFDHTTNDPLDLMINGKNLYRGHVVATGKRRAMIIDEAAV